MNAPPIPDVGNFAPTRKACQSPDMTQWVAELPQAGSGGGLAPAPFDLTVIENPNNSSEWRVSIRPGTVNGILPGNILTPIEIPKNALRYFWVTLNATGGQITTVTLEHGTSHPPVPPVTPAVPPTQVKHVIGLITSANKAYNLARANLVATPVQAFATDKATPGPNELPYVINYSWEVRRDTVVE